MRTPWPIAFALLVLSPGAGCGGEPEPSSGGEGRRRFSPGDRAAPAGLPATLEPTACRFAVPRSVEGERYSCYDLLVPEHRALAVSRTIRVHVAVFFGRTGGVPTIELNGGPGGSSEELALLLAVDPQLAQGYERFLERGDLVLVDQRGTGRSLPRLACREAELMGDPVLGLRACAARLTAQGVDLTGYVTQENADDIHALKLALGVPKVNLHGISYGSRLALELLRRHPDDVAAVIIDGVMPADAGAISEADQNLDALLSRIFAACAADLACAARYPRLDAALSALKAKLDAQPFALGGQPYDWLSFLDETIEGLYGAGFAGELPRRIHELSAMSQAEFAARAADVAATEQALGDPWAELLAATALGREALQRRRDDPDPGAGWIAEGMFQSVVCSDYVQYESLDEALALEAGVRPELRAEEYVRLAFAACEAWPKRAKSDRVFAPVPSDLPVLAVAGRYDPVTPPAWRDRAAATLSASQDVTMGAGAHGAMDPCALGLKLAFIDAPTTAVDDACARQQRLAFAVTPLRLDRGGERYDPRRPPVPRRATPALAPLTQALRRVARGRRAAPRLTPRPRGPHARPRR